MNRLFMHARHRPLSLSFLGGLGVWSATHLTNKYNNDIKGQDYFSKHCREQHQKHWLSGMHEPLMPSQDQAMLFERHFSKFSHLLPTELNAFKERQSLKTPVRIKSLSESPVSMSFNDAGVLIVGGIPAMMSAVSLVKQGVKFIYLNDSRRIPIAYGSAFHVEEDAITEAPTTYLPTQFMANQLKRAISGNVRLNEIEQTGSYPWRTLDWIGWMQHPEHWVTGFKVAFNFQMLTMANAAQRQNNLIQLSKQCEKNERFYEILNEELDGQLLMQEKGSIVVARNSEEELELADLQEKLSAEGRTLRIVSKEEFKQCYGYIMEGAAFGEKIHDRVLSPHFMALMTNHIKKHGQQVIDGTLKNIYVDGVECGGIAEYTTSDGASYFLPFSSLAMSLGSQLVLDAHDQPLFDVVAARGVSMLAYVYMRQGCKIPTSLVCGGTNHVTVLSEEPVSITVPNGDVCDLYLVRMTAGACITPNVSDQDNANYDGSIALGLFTAVQKALGEYGKIEVITTYGCNRQMSQYGQMSWINPFPGVHIQYGAGGGGITRAPDFAVQQEERQLQMR